jgi:hypothetical protein
VTRAALVMLLSLAACEAQEPPPDECIDCVIPPGQERAVLAMLGGRDALRGGCRLASASVEGATVRATYRCPAAELSLTLHHATQAPPGATTAGALALVSADPEARSTGLLDDLAARVRWVSVVREHDERFASDGRAIGSERGRAGQRVDVALRHGVPARAVLLGALVFGGAVAAWRSRRGPRGDGVT